MPCFTENIHGQHKTTWDSGQSYCAQRGGYLPWVQSKQDMRELASQMEAEHLQTAWLGMRKTSLNGLRWMDGTPISK